MTLSGKEPMIMKKRLLSILLVVSLLASMMPCLIKPVHAATEDQNHIVDRADYLYNLTWICQKTVSGWCGNYTYYAGTTYRLPYGQPINAGAYIGYGVSVDNFLTAAKNGSSVFYSSRSTYGSTYSVYYATDCSAFVSWCWDIERKTTYSIPQVSTYLGMATAANVSKLQLGDCLNSNSVGHVVLVTDLSYDSAGNVTKIEITEQTPPQLKRSSYTPTQLGNLYGGNYGIYRYEGTVSEAPETTVITTKYYPACADSFTSLYPALESIGVYCDWDLHCRIAELNGITDFTGTVEQNTRLLDLLKEGKLLNPNYQPVAYYPACDSSYTSLYPALESIGISCDWDLHCRIAEINGIKDFSGTVEQNTQLLDLLKEGKLLDPDASDSDTDTGGTGNFANGYDSGYPGGMPGDGKIYAHGLDVSSWQGASLDFKAIKNAGYDFVILRAGTSYGKDTCFETYYKNARAAGLDIGTYYYTYATTTSAAQTDANNMLEWISGKTFEYPVYFDYEDPSQESLSNTTAKNICLTFLDTLAEAGYLVGLYTGYYKSTVLPTSTICDQYEIWIANYWDYTYTTLSPSYSTKYGMYQYTDRNYVNGAGPFDGDVVFKDYPSIVKQYGFNGYATTNTYLEKCTFYPAYCKVTTSKSTPLNSLPCSASSSYGSVTQQTAEAGMTFVATGLYKNTSSNYWYRITLENGETAFLYGGHGTVDEYLTDDILLSEAAIPGTVDQGSDFEVTGKLVGGYNQLEQVSVGVYNGSSMLGTMLTGGTDTVSGNVYNLTGSTVASNTDFTQLSSGDYKYMITADYTSYYAVSSKELGTHTDTKVLVNSDFTVGEPLPFIEKCTFYPAHCQITTTCATPINTQPADTAAPWGAQTIKTSEGGITYTATGLYRNPDGNYWYLIKTAEGTAGYLFAGDTGYVQDLTTDIYLTDWNLPGNMTAGDSFDMAGTLSATYNRLEQVSVSVSSGATAVLSGSDTVSDNRYSLSGSSLSGDLDFSGLRAGNYLYDITGIYTNYYAIGATELGTNTGAKVLMQSAFSVTDYGVDPSTCTHSYTTRIIQQATCTVNGIVQRSCSLCGQSSQSTILAPGHSYTSVTTPPTCEADGFTTHTCGTCGDVYNDNVVAALGHNYAATVTPPTCNEAGYTTNTCSRCADSFVDHPVAATGHSYTTGFTAPTCEANGYTTYTCVDCGDSFMSDVVAATGHSYTATVTTANCTTNGFTTYTCVDCGDSFTENVVLATGHSYSGGVCTACGKIDPATEYYLFGFINGSDYGCESDYENTGIYRFENGTLTATFTEDSYVAVKTGDNLKWYMTDGWQGNAAVSVKLYNADTLTEADKLFIPGGVEVTFTLTDNGDGTLTLSYEANEPEVQPTLTPRYPTLSFEDEVFINVYFSAADLGSCTAADMGLITWRSARNDGSMENAEAVIPGAEYISQAGLYRVRTAGIPAKNLGDTVYFKIYLKLSDGSYLYSALLDYSPKSYAVSTLATSGSTAQKALVVAMLNYGAVAQTYFNYKPYNLMNSILTEEQKALVKDYTSGMINPVGSVDSSKVGIFTNSGGFSRKYPTVSFEGAFCINYYFVPAYVPSGNVRLYYWTQQDYNAASTLTPANATGSVVMSAVDGEYHGVVEGIAAKDLDGTIYVAAGYLSNGVSYCTGVLAYSIGTYCTIQASTATAMQPFAQATAVYGYYAKQYFSA